MRRGIKGLGELGHVGTNAAVANAVYHATGTRIRELPSGSKNCSMRRRSLQTAPSPSSTAAKVTRRQLIIQLGANRFAAEGQFPTRLVAHRSPLYRSRAEGAHKVPDDVTELERAIQGLLDRYPKAEILAALQETPSRPGPKAEGRLGHADPDGPGHDVASGSF